MDDLGEHRNLWGMALTYQTVPLDSFSTDPNLYVSIIRFAKDYLLESLNSYK